MANAPLNSSTRQSFPPAAFQAPQAPKPAAINYSEVTYQSVPIPQGYSTPLGTIQSPALQPNRYSAAPQQSPLASAGFTPLRREPRTPMTPKTPGDPKTPLSPSFNQREIMSPEDELLAKREAKVEKLSSRDLKWKIRVRMSKVVLRSVNFCCSLVVLALVASALTIFNATKNLPPRNRAPAWAPNTQIWPLILFLSVASVSLIISTMILCAYWRGGHARAEKLAVYWTVIAVGTFIFAIVMWSIPMAILNKKKEKEEGKDLWGWSCKQNDRRVVFQDDIDYKLVCTELNWVSMCAIIEICLEFVTISLYLFVLYRLASKRRLRKSMDLRDKARNDIWLNKLRDQDPEPECPLTANNTAMNAKASVYQPPETKSNTSQQAFQLQPAPKKGRASQDTSAANTPLASPIVSDQQFGQAFSAERAVPATPRSVSFSPENVPIPQTPRSVQFRSITPPEASAMVPQTPRSVSFNVRGGPSPPGTPRSVNFRQ